jgi:opacity protein-like surface antigen
MRTRHFHRSASFAACAALAVVLTAASAGAQQAFEPIPEPTQETVAPTPAPAAEAFDPMHVLKFAIGLGAGYSYVSLGRFNTLVADTKTALQRANPGIVIESLDDTHGAVGAGLSVRGYFPYFIAAEIGANALYAFDDGTARFAGGSIGVEHNELGFEIPILVGGYYPFLGQLFLTGLIGPAILAGPMSLWDQTGNADLTDFSADTGVGMNVLVGLDYMPVDHFAVGIDLRYRYLKSDVLKYSVDGPADGMIVESGQLRGDGTHETYELDFSGFGFQFWLKGVI